MNQSVSDEEFISMMQLWVSKNASYPLELITFLQAENGNKLIAIPDYVTDQLLYLGAKSYPTYQSALTKVGALMDKMDYPKVVKEHKSSHPLSYPDFYRGYSGEPYSDELDKAEWEAGKAYRLELKD
jgi:hypothetical protein